MENKEAPQASDGLVISDISAQGSAEGVFHPRFVSESELIEASQRFWIDPEIPQGLDDLQETNKVFQYNVQLSPGSIRVSRQSLGLSPQRPNYVPKSAIVNWSAKSRAGMVARLLTLDYSSMMSNVNRPPAMITLTYPNEWQSLVPDGATAKKHLRLFQKRFAYEFKQPLVGCWKLEFQRRGAPHFHILCVPPVGVHFRTWLSETWTEIVNPLNTDERQKHLSAGTGLDYAEGLRSYDPKRVAVYFSKHSSASFGDKEYQNRPPVLWTNSQSVGRFWGYWGLRPLIVSTKVSEEDALFVARTLRRWANANSKPRRVEVWRTNTKSGEIKKRHARRRIRRLTGRLGFVSVNDGAEMGADLGRALTMWRL